MEITKGVPQGSVLGPLLYTLYTADFHNFIKYCSILTFADDSQIYISFKPEQAQITALNINEDLFSIKEVSYSHLLSLNNNKSEVVLFGKERASIAIDPNFRISINSNILKINTVCKNLGLFIDNDLRFFTHVNHLVKTCFYILKHLYMHKLYLDTEVKLKLTESLILSRIAYCNVVYWPALFQTN